MVTEGTLLILIKDNCDFPPGMKHMIASVCLPHINADTSADELVEKLKQIKTIEHKASTHYDDDEHWAIESPFDKKWYIFSAFAMGSGWPKKPDSVDETLPKYFNED